MLVSSITYVLAVEKVRSSSDSSSSDESVNDGVDVQALFYVHAGSIDSANNPYDYKIHVSALLDTTKLACNNLQIDDCDLIGTRRPKERSACATCARLRPDIWPPAKVA